jgi:hypothetical protein
VSNIDLYILIFFKFFIKKDVKHNPIKRGVYILKEAQKGDWHSNCRAVAKNEFGYHCSWIQTASIAVCNCTNIASNALFNANLYVYVR